MNGSLADKNYLNAIEICLKGLTACCTVPQAIVATLPFYIHSSFYGLVLHLQPGDMWCGLRPGARFLHIREMLDGNEVPGMMYSDLEVALLRSFGITLSVAPMT